MNQEESNLYFTSQALMAAGPQVKRKRKVDKHCSLSGSGEVHEDYDCMLNQTNIEKNNNKFYVIQVIKAQNDYYVWNRWGRVGDLDKKKQWQSKPMPLESALEDFEKKFKKKTKNNWSDRENFVTHAGKYTMIEVEPIVSSDEEVMESMELDINNMPLGKLSESQITKGFAVLDEIEEAMNQEMEQTRLQELSSKFFTTIPHNVGWKRLETIKSKEIVEKKKMLEIFREMAKRLPIDQPQHVQ